MCGDNNMFKGQEGNTNLWRYDVRKQFYKIKGLIYYKDVEQWEIQHI